jgi:serine/threonine protein phosphatase 1
VSRYLAIGDIHGCLTALRALTDLVAPGADDTLVTLGDYVDRGPDSRGVLDFIIGLRDSCNHVALRGNHEIMMLDASQKSRWRGPWLQYGGDATLLSYSSGAGDDPGSFDDVPDAHIDLLENGLESFFECDSHFFVHANADPEVPLDMQSDANLFWRKYDDPKPHCSGKIMVCGHSVQPSGLPITNGHSICIDTWAYGDGWLSCLDVGSGQVWQANEAGQTRSFMLDEVSEL